MNTWSPSLIFGGTGSFKYVALLLSLTGWEFRRCSYWIVSRSSSITFLGLFEVRSLLSIISLAAKLKPLQKESTDPVSGRGCKNTFGKRPQFSQINAHISLLWNGQTWVIRLTMVITEAVEAQLFWLQKYQTRIFDKYLGGTTQVNNRADVSGD